MNNIKKIVKIRLILLFLNLINCNSRVLAEDNNIQKLIAITGIVVSMALSLLNHYIDSYYKEKVVIDKLKKSLSINNKNNFFDIGGNEVLKKELEKIIYFFKNNSKDVNFSLPKGIIFYGPPGSGKTYLVKAIAGTANIPVFILSASDLEEKNNEPISTEERIAYLYKEARKKAPCIVYIDEAESIIRNRNKCKDKSNGLIQFLNELDGFDKKNENILTIFSTNFIDDVDPALYRAGRADRIFYIGSPVKKDRISIIKTIIKKLNIDLDNEFLIEDIADKLEGKTSGEINSLFNKIILNINYKNKNINNKIIINEKNFDLAYKDMFYGLINNFEVSEKEITIKAYNMAAKGLIILNNKNYPYNLDSLSIVSRENHLGIIIENLKSEQKIFSYEEYLAIVDSEIAGILVEKIFFNGNSFSHNEENINKIKNLLTKAYKELGMGKKIFYQDDNEINKEINSTIIERMNIVKKIIIKNIDKIKEIAYQLLDKKSVFKKDLLKIIEKKVDDHQYDHKEYICNI